MSFGGSLDSHREAPPSYLPDGDPGRQGGGTYTAHSVEPTLEAYENIFGPSARDIKQDLQRFKRHGRWHLPDILKGPNQYLTDRVDGLITDAASSPFTSRILPYKYITNVDGKIKWNVWSFDEGLASRVPYESAARTLTQTKRSYAGYFIRQGMAIVLEHNFMMTEAGRENFRRQLNQLVGSIQLTNDLDVHVALVLAPSYQKTMNERYLTQDKSSAQICREFVELFGFVQKNQNALDILIEEAKGQLKTWGAPMPDFMLCNSKLTFQLTMTPDATNYVTQGPEGAKKLKTGPTLSSYRGIGIVHTRAFSMETGAPPRDMLRRRVRVAEYYRVLPHKDNHKRLFQIYNEERDTWSTFTFQDLLKMALCDRGTAPLKPGPGQDNNRKVERAMHSMSLSAAHEGGAHGAAPARLGEVIDPQHVHISQRQDLADLYTQLMIDKKAEKDFSWEPRFLDDKLVFVPGSVDLKAKDNVMDKNSAADIAKEMPEFIRKGIESVINTTAVGAMTTENLNRIKVVVQSVAPYHRNAQIVAFQEAMTAPVLTQVRPKNWQIVDLRGLPPASTNAAIIIRMYTRLACRNYMRFGIPTEILQGTAQWGDQSTTLKQAINLGKDFKNGDFYLDQTLRNMGAWFSPNHFKHPVKNFSNIGDQLAYHALVYDGLTSSCHFQRVLERDNKDVNTVHAGTLLADIIKYPAQHQDLYKEVKKILVEINADVSIMGQKVTRSMLAERFLKRLTTAMDTHATSKGHDKVDTYLKHVDKIFWLFPRTTSCSEEVFCSNAQTTTKWKKDLWSLAQFKNDLNITEAVVNAITTSATFDNSPESINYAVQMPKAFDTVTDQDVASMFKMLAWRMWADQEVSLETVYRAADGVWPSTMEAFLFPSHSYPHARFGFGVMNYRDGESLVPSGTSAREARVSSDTEHVEVVIVRPNIEHHMLGIILGQGGESLGSTFWGQTELSCYDDSMHGIWGMSYKYHERAIVINERNLIRLWDIAYDGYVGGKDDTYVRWDDESEHAHSRPSFMQATTDVTRPYRGPSMMVMAFDHLESKNTGGMGSSVFKESYSPNWPSPIVFYDRLDHGSAVSAKADFDNLHAVDVAQFRVFNNPAYHNSYAPYKHKMPDFWELHTIRKNAGLAATENEVSSDALAFQGTMRVLSADSGAVIQEVLGSGHHGPDFIGVASLRAGKGYRLNSQPTMHRLV